MRFAAALLLVAVALPGADADDDWVLTLENGDVLHVSLRAIEDGKIVVRWQVTPDDDLKLAIPSISCLARPGADDEPPEAAPDQDMLRLRDDAILYGRAIAIGPVGVDFDVPQVGRLRFPAADIVDLTRGPPPSQIPEAKEGEFAVVTTRGVALTGKIVKQEEGRIVFEGGGVTAAVDCDAIAMLAFPRPALIEGSDEPPSLGIELKLRNGSLLAGREPAIADGNVRFRVGGVQASVPLAQVMSVSFRESGTPVGRANLRSVLAWGRWSDPLEEFRRTVDAVKSELGSSWTVAENMTSRYDEAFRHELFGARVLLIPEMERLPPTPTDAPEMKPLLEAFVRSGGNVIVCGAQGPHLAWLRDAGLIELEGAGQVDGAEVTFTTHGSVAGKGIRTFPAMNATNSYLVRSPDAVTLAEANGKAVVVGRRVGRGWVLVVGSDYYMSNKGATKLLGNLVKLR
jgi:hypothetical protein